MHHLSPWTMHRDVSLEHCCTACTSFRNDASCLSRQFQPELQKCSTSLRVTFSNPQNYVNYGFFNLQTKPLLFCNSGSSLLYYQRLYTEPPLHPNSSLVCSTAVAIDLLLLFFIKNNISRFSSKR